MFNTIHAELLFMRGQKEARSGNLEESVRLLDRAISRRPSYSGLYLHKALALSKQKNYAEAYSAFERAIELDSGNFANHLFLGITCLDDGKTDEADKAFNRALKMAPKNILASCYQAFVRLKENPALEEAQKSLHGHIVFANTDFKSRYLLFCESILLKHHVHALSLDSRFFYDVYLKKKPLHNKTINRFKSKSALFFNNLVYFYSSRKKKACRHYLAGEEKLKKGDFEAAVSAYNAALKLCPDYEDAQEKLLDIYFYRKDYHLVIDSIERFYDYKHDPSLSIQSLLDTMNDKYVDQHPYLIFNLALYFYHTQAYPKALALFKSITRLFPEHYFNLYYLGLCYLAENELDNALETFKKALDRLNPEIAKQRLEELMRVSS